MNLFSSLKNILLFKFSFEIDSKLKQDLIRESFHKMVKSDISFLYPAFKDNEFAFSHKNTMPKFYNYSPIYFEGEIIGGSKTIIKIKVRVMPFVIWIGVVAILAIFFGDFLIPKEKQINDPQSFPLKFYSFLYFISIYAYYIYKIIDVKGIIKSFVKREELKNMP